MKKYSALTREVHIRNMCAFFQDKSKTASIPEVGIFWVDVNNPTKKIWGKSIPLNKAETWDGNKIYSGDHYSEWKEIKRENPKWKHFEYEEIPRGRIVFFADPNKNIFRVYLPKKLKKNMEVQEAIKGVYNLPEGHVEFYFEDFHYQI
ncbi:MAG: hypothetical protein WC511_02320 [Candidatus Pacearchaeota archaeon]